MPVKPPPGDPEPRSGNPPTGGPVPLHRFASDLLSRIWQKSLPMVQDRVARLEACTAALAEGALTPENRTQAADLAHKLAGSLGMFGLPEGTEIARAMEHMLDAEAAIDLARYSAYAARLRALVGPWPESA